MTRPAPGTLHLIATLALLASLVGVGVVQAGVLETPAGGFGVIDRPGPAPRPDGFGTMAGGDPNV
ncbi:hypothetical protein [Hasllibacter sp. MH4015]|uniref:hypothetical protein n=1 Tax=Hasllibacter sp. MH4015 TaxID=2854029 RepID=UPI001CD3A8EF|nr:hypothetical protein [Hasllibacter sp. MH4015]